MTDTGTGRDATKARVGNQGHVLAEGQVLEGRGQLVGLLHAGAHGADPRQYQHIAGADVTRLDGNDRLPLPREHASRTLQEEHPLGRQHRGIDGGALNDSPLGSQVAPRKRHRAGEAAFPGQGGRQDHRIRIHTVQLLQSLTEHRPTLGPRPRLEGVTKPIPRGRQRLEVEQPEISQVQHHLGHAARQEGPHRGMVGGSIGHHAHEAGRAAVNGDPIVHRGSAKACRMGDGRDVQQQVGRTAKGRMDGHRITQRGVGQDRPRGQADLLTGHERTSRVTG